MLVEVKVPQLSESVEEATLLSWHKREGEAVKRDENLIDIETDKVVLELPAPADGVLTKVVKSNGGTVRSGEVIATIETEAKASVSAAAPPSAPAANAPIPEKEKQPAIVPPTPVKAVADPVQDTRLMPAAKKIAEEAGIDTIPIAGTGRDGRITKGDVLSHMSAPNAPTAAPKTSLAPVQAPVDVERLMTGRPEQRVPMSRLRARIAERLVQSQSTAAILTTFNEVNMKPVMDLRKRYQERFEKEHGVKLGFMSFFIKASVHALKKYPIVNASVDGNDIVYHGYFDIGVAVSSPRGLVVPIIRDCDQLSLADIEKRISDFAHRAQEGKLALEELAGGTFSISNGGVFGSMLSTPIINPPQSAILGVHATKDRPVVENGEIVIRPMNYLALSYDHRIIDGREAVMALVAIKEALEDPARMLLDL